ncbi:MAG: SGNH/GDSL hydrolase family protein [Magnetococcales bacterium]|nr:SGNH/GDSL hydrolase family protein [Magnetococcales bacterium]
MNKDPNTLSFSRRKTLLFSILSILIGILFIEGVSYLTIMGLEKFGMSIQTYPYHHYLGWENRKNDVHRVGGHCSFGVSAAYGYIETDALGHSITPLTYDNPEYKIVVTGGSTMFGGGSSTHATSVPAQLEKIIFAETGVKAEVTNLGVSGYQSFQEMLAFYRHIKSFDADLVLAISGRNDASYAFKEPDMRSASLLSEVYERIALINPYDSDGSFMRSTVSFFKAHSFSFDLLHVVLPKIFRRIHDFLITEEDGSQQLPGEDEEGGRVYENIPQRVKISSQHYSLMNTMARERGIDFIMMLQPTAFTKPVLTEIEKRCVTSRIWRDKRLSNNVLKIYEQRFFQAFREIPKSYPFQDMTGVFDNVTTTSYVDMCHYNDAGAEVLARGVFEVIRHRLPPGQVSKAN